MNITETVRVDIVVPTEIDGRWMFVEVDPSAGVVATTTGRTAQLDVPELRKLRAVFDHLIEAAAVTSESLEAAIAAEFAE